jgi:hypothetical protein
MNNSGAVACASETDDLAQCLAERLTQKNEDEAGRLKKRYKARDEMIGLALPLQAKQQQESIPLSRVLMQLTVREGVAFKQSIDGAPESSVVVKKASAKAESKTEMIKIAKQRVSTADDATSAYSAPQAKHVNNGSLMSSVPSITATSVQPLASITANITSYSEGKSQDEKSEKSPEIITPTPRVILTEHNQALPAIKNQKQAIFTTETKPIPTVLQRHAESDFSPAIMTKSLNIDLQADKIELHYPITDQAVVKLQLTEQAIAPVSSNVRVSEMLVGQAALSNYDPGWLLHGAKQSRPYYLSLSGNDQKGKTENNLWKDREE